MECNLLSLIFLLSSVVFFSLTIFTKFSESAFSDAGSRCDFAFCRGIERKQKQTTHGAVTR